MYKNCAQSQGKSDMHQGSGGHKKGLRANANTYARGSDPRLCNFGANDARPRILRSLFAMPQILHIQRNFKIL